jgi:TatA/E family protein of Tat protein translocase
MGPLGWQETVFIFALALLVFGPKKLPELGKTIGKAFTEFRRASSDLKATFDREMSDLEREGESLKKITSSYQNELNDSDSSYNYEDGYDDSDSYDSTATDSSTVSASAPEGAESENTTASDPGSSTASTSGEQPSPTAEAAVPGSAGPSEEATPGETAGGVSASESKTVTS